MKDPNENRTYDRYSHKANLICSRFNTDTYYNTQKCNHGGGGLRFESHVPFQKGTVLHIRMTDYSTDGLFPDAWEGFRTMAIGEVKWCQEISDDQGTRYNVGVRYHDPVY